MNNINTLKAERHRLNHMVSKVINAISGLYEEDQKIICYRYFENLSYTEIAKRTGLSSGTIPRRIKKYLLRVGRNLFGFEDEFWKEFDE